MDNRFHKGHFVKDEVTKYLSFRPQNRGRHLAHVLVSYGEKTVCNTNLYVCIDAYCKITIEGNDAYATYCKSSITMEDDHVLFVNGALWIHTSDIWGNPISVEVGGIS